jgi:membrane protease YdiL (CAAX protease family)
MSFPQETDAYCQWRVAHGAVLLAMISLLYLGPVVRSWPWFWLMPLAAYLAVVVCVPPLRRSFQWPRVGQINWRTCSTAAAITLLAVGSLVLYQIVQEPDLAALGARLPVEALGGTLSAGIVFALVNATLEEAIFRGVLFDALEVEWGWPGAVLATSVLFALGHLNGYPPGWFGAFLAGIYGIMLGGLRVLTGGLLLPVISHIAADATIYCILARGGVV